MKTAESALIVLFDGDCNLCNSSVQFIIHNDPNGNFRFCSLQSNAAALLLDGRRAATVSPDSVVLLEDGCLYVRSTAALKIAQRLRSPWNLFAGLLLVPVPIRDYVYRLVASNRRRLFKKRATCMVQTAETRARFLDNDERPQTGIINGVPV